MAQSKEKKKLEDFNLTQLNILLEHLRFGYDHLKTLLNPEQLKELFNWIDLEERQKRQIATDRIEKVGNMSLIINTLLTSTFGAWMGLSGCIGWSLGSYKTLTFIFVLAFFISSCIGYMSLHITKNQAHNAIRNQLLHQFELRVLKIINRKIEEKQDFEISYLNAAVAILNKDNKDIYEFKNRAQAYQWYENLMEVITNRLKEVNDPFSVEISESQIQRMSLLIKKTLAKHFQFLEDLTFAKDREKKQIQIVSTLPFLKVLTRPSFSVTKYHAIHPSSWLRKHFSELVLGIVPTIWGGFASMFVFVQGFPNIAKELGFLSLHATLTSPFARQVEISLAVAVTCYFAFAFLYSSRKSWQRARLLEGIDKNIVTEEAHLLENNHRLDMLFKLKMHTQKMISLFTVVKKMDQNLDISSDSKNN